MRATATGVAVTVEGPTGVQVLEAATLFVATGRRPNTDLLDVAAGGLAVDDHGRLVTDGTLSFTRRPDFRHRVPPEIADIESLRAQTGEA